MIRIPYGTTEQSAPVPEDWNSVPLAIAGAPEGDRSEGDILLDALAHPIASAPLADRLTGGERITIIVSDKTRSCRTDLVLPAVLAQLTEAGIPSDRITILFANGTHPPQTPEEIAGVIGSEIAAHYMVLENHAREDEHVLAGTTVNGTPIELHRAAMEADFVIAIGTIIHHYFAGYGGGAKLFMPGVASYRSATTNHKRTLTEDGRFNPACRDGVFDGNPVADDIWDAVRFFPPHFYIGTVLDGSGRIAHCVAGELPDAHRQGCRYVDDMYAVQIQEPADCVIVSPGGYPKDINLIQTHKSLHHASYAVKDGGTIICAAECRDGIGNPSFMKWFSYESDAELRRAVLDNYVMNAHTAIALHDKCRRYKVVFVSSLDPDEVRKTGMTPASSLEEAVAMAAQSMPSNPLVYTIANGFITVPMMDGGSV